MSTGEDNNDDLVKQEDLPEGIILRDHVVDGIQEYDQRMPFWWICILFGMIVFSIIYWLVMDDRSFEGGRHAELEARLQAISTARLANSIDVTNDELFWEMASNPAFISAGQATYEANCVACHGKDLQGGIGFNLVDSEWIHGSKPSELYVSISGGFIDKGMQAWEPLLGQKRITEVVAYVLSKNDRATLEAAQSPTETDATSTGTDASTAEDLPSDSVISSGADIYKANCSACHGPKLKGVTNLGSDLTDSIWVAGGTRAALINTVTNGIIEKGMVPWKSVLSEQDITAVVDYVVSQNPNLKGQ
jgi:cytochrome c oxidase cbb3-type subunit 3